MDISEREEDEGEPMEISPVHHKRATVPATIAKASRKTTPIRERLQREQAAMASRNAAQAAKAARDVQAALSRAGNARTSSPGPNRSRLVAHESVRPSRSPARARASTPTSTPGQMLVNPSRPNAASVAAKGVLVAVLTWCWFVFGVGLVTSRPQVAAVLNAIMCSALSFLP